MTSPTHAKTSAKTGSRFYVHPLTGEKAPSVTSILKCLSKPALVPWASKLTAQWAVDNQEVWARLGRLAAVDLVKGEANRVMTASRDLGSLVHNIVESRLTGGQPNIPLAAVSFILSFDAFVEAFRPEYLHVEATVWSRAHVYAGSLDAIARIGDEVWLIDIKTGSGVYAETAMQLAAYSRADFILCADGTEAEMPKVDRAGVLHLRPEGFQLVPVEIDDEVFGSFLHAQGLCNFMDVISKRVIGDALRPAVA